MTNVRQRVYNALAAIDAKHNQKMVAGLGINYTTKNGRQKDYKVIRNTQIIDMLENPQNVDKSKALWAIFTTTPSRATILLIDGLYENLWFDIDEGNVSLGELKEFLAKLGGVALVYSTKSSTDDCKKWRGIIPLLYPIWGKDFDIYQSALNDRLESFGITPDRKAERIHQICFLPNRGQHYETLVTGSELLFAQQEFCNEVAYKIQEKAAIKASIMECNERSLQRATVLLSSGLSPINAFKTAYDLKNLMLAYGYKFKQDRFLSPRSESGVYQGRLTDNGKKWLSHHGSDMEVGIGRTNGKVCSGDVFDMFVFHECHNEFKEAVTKAGEMFNPPDGRTITQANRDTHNSLANPNIINIDTFIARSNGGMSWLI